MKPAPATSHLTTKGVAGSAVDDSLGQLARFESRSLGEPHGDVGREIAIGGIARALDRRSCCGSHVSWQQRAGEAGQRLVQQLL